MFKKYAILVVVIAVLGLSLTACFPAGFITPSPIKPSAVRVRSSLKAGM